MAVVDVDLFGKVNEMYGRDTGDAVIRLLTSLLENQFSGSARVFRYGGDAWSLLWDGFEKEHVFLAMERFRESVSSPQTMDLESGTAVVSFTVSAGLAASPDDGMRPQDLINKAHEALYRAKVAGRNRVCLAREEKMVTKTSYYTQGQLMGLRRLAERMGIKDAELLREALNDLLLKHNA